MEASALPASAGLTRARLGLGAPLLRLRPDEQLVSLFRAGNEDAFRVIHDRYRARMLAYARQMLASSSADAEDAVQEIFVRAYAGLRANQRDLALRAWLYRIAHNRCVDELRRPRPVAVEAVEDLREAPGPDPHARVEQREVLRRLIVDVQHLPEQQRSALLMRELGGMPYADLAGALGVSVPAVKSLLVRARVGLAQASEARDTACASIREDLVVAHDRGLRANGRARRHMRDCTDCRRFRTEVQGMSRNLGLLIPALGPLAIAAKLIGLGGIGGGGSAAAGSGTGAAAGASVTAASVTGSAAVGGSVAAGATGTAAVTGTTAAAGGTVAAAGAAVTAGASTGALATAGAAAGTAHVATILAATAIAAGGAIGIQHEVSTTHRPVRIHHATALAAVPRSGAAGALGAPSAPTKVTAQTPGPASTSDTTVAGAASRTPVPHVTATSTLPASSASTSATRSSTASGSESGVTALASNTGVPAATTSTTATAPTATDPTTTTGTTTATDPTVTSVTSADPTGTDPTSTDPTSTDPTTTAPAVATTPTTATPIAGSSTGGDPVTSTTPVTTTGHRSANPGTATGIVPTVSSATTWASTGRSWRRIRLQTWRDAPRGVAPGWTSVER